MGAARSGQIKKAIAEQHKINAAGAQILSGLLNLTSGWVLRSEQGDGLDYHIDYSCEVAEGDNPSGRVFRVQLKSRRKVLFRENRASAAIDVRDLKYYAQCRMPVFLAVTCVETRCVYWVFVQQYLRERAKKAWEGRTSLSMSMDRGATVSDQASFRAAVAASFTYMEELYPGSLRAAAARRKAELEAKYPGVGFDVALEDGHEHLTINPKQPISGKLTFKIAKDDEDARARFRGFLTGKSAQFSRDELEVVGLPEAGTGPDTATRTITAGAEVPSVCVLEVNGDGPARDIIGAIPASTTLNAGGFHCAIEDEWCPLQMEASVIMEEMFAEQLGPHQFNASFDFAVWKGKPIAWLPYFVELERAAGALAAGQAIQLTMKCRGGLMASGMVNNTQVGDFVFFIDVMRRLRLLDQTFGLGLSFVPFNEWGDQNANMVRLLSSAMLEGRVELTSDVKGVVSPTPTLGPGVCKGVIRLPFGERELFGKRSAFEGFVLEVVNPLLTRNEDGSFLVERGRAGQCFLVFERAAMQGADETSGEE